MTVGRWEECKCPAEGGEFLFTCSCPPFSFSVCKSARPSCALVLAEEKKEKALLLSVDTTSLADLSARMGVKGLPAFILYQSGQQVESFSSSKWDTIVAKITPLLPTGAAAIAPGAPVSAPKVKPLPIARGQVMQVTSEEQLRGLLAAAGARPVVLKFSAPWCHMCRKTEAPFAGTAAAPALSCPLNTRECI